MEKVKVKLLKALYPYAEWEIAEMREEVAKMWAEKWYVEILDNEEKKSKVVKENKSMEDKKVKKNKAL
jgi:hypothetical protein